MKRLKILLQSNLFIFTFLIAIFLYVLITTVVIKYESAFNGDETHITGIVSNLTVTNNKLKFILNTDAENISVSYYIKDYDYDYTNLISKTVKVDGKLNEVLNNTIPNTFNYKKYLYYNNMFYTFTATNFEIINEEKTFIGSMQYLFYNRVSNLKSEEYLRLFIIGDKSLLNSDIYSNYQSNGMAHLLAISGLHINLFISILEKMLRKLKEKSRFTFIFSFLIFYLFLTDFLVSVIRCVIFRFLKFANTLLNIKLTDLKLLIYTFFIMILINPFYVYNVGFQYSFIIVFFLMLIPKKKRSFISSSLMVSFISFLASLPITVNMNYEINLSSIMFNLLFVPLVSLIIYPLSLITFILPFFDNILRFCIDFMEWCNNICFSYFSIIFNIPHMTITLILLYYLFLYMYLIFKKRYILFLFICTYYGTVLPKFDSSYYIYYLDIGQGDCTLLVSPYQKEVIMIDTGGNYFYSVSDNVIIFLKSLGIKKIDLLILTHGDSDHVLETENIYNNISIDNLFINFNNVNDLEGLIKNLNIPEVYEVNLKYFKSKNINEYTGYDENKSSLFLYFKFYDYSFLFPGDITIEETEVILNKYNFTVDFLKVSHHGSKYSTSYDIISKLNPRYGFISAGRSNNFGHPSPDVIDMLNYYNVNTYLTTTHGTIKLEINKNMYNIFTFEP